MFENISNFSFDDASQEEVIKPKFIEFGSFNQIQKTASINVSGNLIKSKEFQVGNKIEVRSEDSDQPTIVIRKSGENVDSIEFSCKCGRASSVHMKYDND